MPHTFQLICNGKSYPSSLFGLPPCTRVTRMRWRVGVGAAVALAALAWGAANVTGDAGGAFSHGCTTQIGVYGCEAKNECEWGSGMCEVKSECVQCLDCLDTIEEASKAGDPETVREACASLGLDTCNLVDWPQWMAGTGGLGFKAACAALGVCPVWCIGANLCSGDNQLEPSDSVSGGACQTSEDCPGSMVCQYEAQDSECLAARTATCNSLTGYFDTITCLGYCTTAPEAVCSRFAEEQRAMSMDLLWDYSPLEAQKVLHSSSTVGLEGYLQGLSVCSTPQDCSPGTICIEDSRCSLLGTGCDINQGIYRVGGFACNGFCSPLSGAPNPLEVDGLAAHLSSDGSQAVVTLPFSVSSASVYAKEVFTNHQLLGVGAHVTASKTTLTIVVGMRKPFLAGELTASLIFSDTNPLAVRLTGQQVLGRIELVAPAGEAVATPLEPYVEQGGVLGRTCAGATPQGAIRAEAGGTERWADLQWTIVNAPSVVLSEFKDVIVPSINARPFVHEKSAIYENDFQSTWPNGIYVIRLDVYNYMGRSASSTVTFSLPRLVAGVEQTTFRKHQGLDIVPTTAAVAGCDDMGLGSVIYSWTSVDGKLPIATSNKQHLVIPPHSPWVTPGESYLVNLKILTPDSVILMDQDTEVVCLRSAIGVSISGPTTARADLGFSLRASILDAEHSSEPVAISWLCKHDGGVCFSGLDSPVIDGFTYTVAPGGLAPGAYDIQVTVVKGDRSAFTSRQLLIISGASDPPLASILHPCAGLGCGFMFDIVDPANAFSLWASIEGTQFGQSQDAVLSWSWDTEQTDPLASYLTGPATSQFVAVTPAGLGLSRQLSVTATVSNATTGASSAATVILAINDGPRCLSTEEGSGSDADCFRVYPSSGRAVGETPFNAEAIGWIDDGTLAVDSNTELNFRFGFCEVIGCPSGTRRIWTSDTTDVSRHTYRWLPAGDELQDYGRTLILCASDVHLGIIPVSDSCAMKTVQVLPAQGPPEPQTFDELSKALEAAETQPANEALVELYSAMYQVAQSPALGAAAGQALHNKGLGIVSNLLVQSSPGVGLLSAAVETTKTVATSYAATPSVRASAVDSLVLASSLLGKAEGASLTATQDLSDAVLAALDASTSDLLEAPPDMSTERSSTNAVSANAVAEAPPAVDTNQSSTALTWMVDGTRRLLDSIGDNLASQTSLGLGGTRAGSTNAQVVAGQDFASGWDGTLVAIDVGGQPDTEGGTNRRRRLQAIEHPTTPGVGIPEGFGESCRLNPSSCPQPVNLQVSYTRNSAYLLLGLGDTAFLNAVAEFVNETVPTDVTVNLVSGRIGLRLPDVGPDMQTFGGTFSLQIPLDMQLDGPSVSSRLCARIDYTAFRPVVFATAVELGDGALALCETDVIGDFVVLQLVRGAAPAPPSASYVPGRTKEDIKMWLPGPSGISGLNLVLYFFAATAGAVLIAGIIGLLRTRMLWSATEHLHGRHAQAWLELHKVTVTRDGDVVWSEKRGRLSRVVDRCLGRPGSERVEPMPEDDAAPILRTSPESELTATKSRGQTSSPENRSSWIVAKQQVAGRRISPSPTLEESSVLAAVEDITLSADPSLADIADLPPDGILAAAAAGSTRQTLEALKADSSCLSHRDAWGRSAMHLAAAGGHVKLVGELLRVPGGPELLNSKDDTGRSPLHVASLTPATKEALEAMLEWGGSPLADASATDDKGNTPLHYAARRGNQYATKVLLKYRTRGVNISCRNKLGQTPLHLGIVAESLSVTASLLTTGGQQVADINARDVNGQTALHLAAERGLVESLGTLLSLGASSSVNVQHPGDSSAQVKFAFEVVASASGSQSQQSSWLDVHQKDNRGWTALHVAAGADQTAAVKVLLGARGPLAQDVNVPDLDMWTPLHLAAANGCRASVHALLLDGRVVPTIADADGWTPLHVAALNGKAGPIRELLAWGAENGTPLSKRDASGATPLQLAAIRGHITAVRALLEANGDDLDVGGPLHAEHDDDTDGDDAENSHHSAAPAMSLSLKSKIENLSPSFKKLVVGVDESSPDDEEASKARKEKMFRHAEKSRRKARQGLGAHTRANSHRQPQQPKDT